MLLALTDSVSQLDLELVVHLPTGSVESLSVATDYLGDDEVWEVIRKFERVPASLFPQSVLRARHRSLKVRPCPGEK